MYTTRALSNYIYDLRADMLPSEAREMAISCILDLLTAAIAGFHLPSVAATRHVAGNLFGEGKAAIWFSGQSITVAGAALCNSAAASVLDLDDGNRAARGHPGAAVIPVAFAVAMETGAQMDETLTAIMAGYEVGVRIAAARNPENTPSRQSGRWTGYAAVAAAGLLRHTDPDKLSHALAIAGVLAPNQEANGSSGYSALTGNDVKEGIPWSTVTGITALQLARCGQTGPEDILDHASHFDAARIIENLGAKPKICMTYFKPYSCCRYIHPALDAFINLTALHSLSANDIVSVDIHIFDWALKLGNRRVPRNLTDVQYSIPYCIALVAIENSAALLPIRPQVLDNPEAIEFSRKVTMHTDPALDERFPEETLARVVITTSTGRFESPVTTPRGEPTNPMSSEDIKEKFRKATQGIMTSRQQQNLLDAINQLIEGNLEPLMKILQQPVLSAKPAE